MLECWNNQPEEENDTKVVVKGACIALSIIHHNICYTLLFFSFIYFRCSCVSSSSFYFFPTLSSTFHNTNVEIRIHHTPTNKQINHIIINLSHTHTNSYLLILLLLHNRLVLIRSKPTLQLTNPFHRKRMRPLLHTNRRPYHRIGIL